MCRLVAILWVLYVDSFSLFRVNHWEQTLTPMCWRDCASQAFGTVFDLRNSMSGWRLQAKAEESISFTLIFFFVSCHFAPDTWSSADAWPSLSTTVRHAWKQNSYPSVGNRSGQRALCTPPPPPPRSLSLAHSLFVSRLPVISCTRTNCCHFFLFCFLFRSTTSLSNDVFS